jgi:hypothetical protein
MFLLLLKVVVLNVEMLKIVINCYRVETRENKTEENKKVSVAEQQQASWRVPSSSSSSSSFFFKKEEGE